VPDTTADRPDDVVFRSVAPVVPVRDLAAALERYRRLGFAVRAYEGGGYGYADRDGVALHLAEWPELDPARTGSQVYYFVSDADAVHEQWRRSGVPGRLVAPTDAPYGLREFAFVDEDGTLHRVGSPLGRP
jgi:catechol 2,3-dioxygenase-like lactoylglutathione lyase family enzyme